MFFEWSLVARDRTSGRNVIQLAESESAAGQDSGRAVKTFRKLTECPSGGASPEPDRLDVRDVVAQLGRDDAERPRQQRRDEPRRESRSPPAAPDDGEPDRPVLERDRPDGPVRLCGKVDDAGNPKDDQDGDDVDPALPSRSVLGGTAQRAKRQ